MLDGYCLGPPRSLSGTPVDQAARAVCALAGLDRSTRDVETCSAGGGNVDSKCTADPDAIGAVDETQHANAAGTSGASKSPHEGDVRVYHIPITMTMPVHQLLKMIMRSPRLRDRPMRVISGKEWSGLISTLRETNPMFPFAASFKNGMGGATAHVHTRTTALLETSVPLPHTYPSEDADVTTGGAGNEGSRVSGDGDSGLVVSDANKLTLSKRPYTQDEVDRVVSFILSQCDL